MDSVSLHFDGRMGERSVPVEHLPPGLNECDIRNGRNPGPGGSWRRLRAEEIGRLEANGNRADDWGGVLVADEFDPEQIRGCRFVGLVRIGRVRRAVLEHQGWEAPAGITDSLIVDCDIGDDAAIHGVRHLARYIIEDRCILANVGEMYATSHARFGNGVGQEEESEDAPAWLELMNENGARRVLAFDGMICADAYLWAKYRDDSALQTKLMELTLKEGGSRRGHYGTVGDQSVIRSCRILRDVRVGAHCGILGADLLENVTINSSQAEPSYVGSGVELVDGIVGCGCHVSQGSKARRFVLASNSNLKDGARVVHCFVGDNSTIACCEVQNNLVFPSHEQHHNNSFLIASVLLGQSNVAAGATIGSNHNSRASDGEVQAGRGFWPGLCASVKHSSRFASFTLLAKGDYPAELDVPLPFALVNNNVARDRLEVMPAYWWLHNMYALARNSWKFQARDKRVSRVQHIEYEALAPDTAEEMLRARGLLRLWCGKAHLRLRGTDPADRSGEELERIGGEVLEGGEDGMQGLEVRGEGMENSKRPAIVLGARLGYHAYGDMLHYYAVKTLLPCFQADSRATPASMAGDQGGGPRRSWVNLGGQLVTTNARDLLCADIRSGRLSSWNDVHGRYDELWRTYPLEKQMHAYAVLGVLLGVSSLTEEHWQAAIRKAVVVQEYVRDQVWITRKKDFDNPFRKATFESTEEMQAVLGTVEDNDFVKQVAAETERFKQAAEESARRA
jgi:NDP-sugar pyrophosphorylase family protein